MVVPCKVPFSCQAKWSDGNTKVVVHPNRCVRIRYVRMGEQRIASIYPKGYVFLYAEDYY